MSTDIVIVHYQNLEDTKRCINSLSKLEQVNFQIVIVDSASPNGSGKKLNFDNVKLILLEENNGFAYACNKGIEQSDADYIWLLNPDTTVEPDALSELLKASRGNNDAVAFGSKVLYGDRKDKIWSAGGKLKISEQEVRMIGNMQNAKNSFLLNHFCDYLPGCSIFASREIFKKNKLPEKYFMYFEETDWCCGLRQRLMYVSKSIVYHHTKDEKMQSVFHIYYYNRNSLFFWFKYSGILSKSKIYLKTLLISLPRSVYAYYIAKKQALENKAVFKAHMFAYLDFLLFKSGKKSID